MTTMVTTWWQDPSVETISWTILWPLQWSQCTQIDIWMMMVVIMVMALMELGGRLGWHPCPIWIPLHLIVGAHIGLTMMETLFIVSARGHGGHDDMLYDTLAHLCWSLLMMSMEPLGSIADGLEETKKPMAMMKLDVPLHTCSPWLRSWYLFWHMGGFLSPLKPMANNEEAPSLVHLCILGWWLVLWKPLVHVHGNGPLRAHNVALKHRLVTPWHVSWWLFWSFRRP